jgi:hypothetical protein
MNAQIRILILSGAACFAVGVGAAWAGRQAASAPPAQAKTETTEPDSLSEKNDMHVKIADRTKSYLVNVTKNNALKVDGSGVTQPVSIVSPTGVNGDLPSNTTSPDLGFPMTLTMCWNADQVTVQESIDGKAWYPSLTTQAAKDTGIMVVGIGCMSVPPARFVRWTSQDYLFQKADGMFQASY